MSIIIQKFGGTSVASLENMQNVALRIKQEIAQGNQVVVVVSAMAGVTQYLLRQGFMAYEGAGYCMKECDALIATGEQASSSLMALVLQKQGISARSWQGWQVPITTDNPLLSITCNPRGLHDNLMHNIVPVVAGFQGISTDGRIITLGRGGSDTSAVILAHSLKATRCDIYTDVDGIYSADPRLVPTASKLYNIDYDNMLTMANFGSKVLQPLSVHYGKKHHVKLRVLSSFEDKPGSIVSEKGLARGIVGLASKDVSIGKLDKEMIAQFSYPSDGRPLLDSWQIFQDEITLSTYVIIREEKGVASHYGKLFDTRSNCSCIAAVGPRSYGSLPIIQATLANKMPLYAAYRKNNEGSQYAFVVVPKVYEELALNLLHSQLEL